MTLLSEEQVAALVTAAQDGTLAEGQALATPKRRAPVVRNVDFRRTHKFKSDQQDRIKRAVETFCRTASSRIASDLRAPTDFQLADVEQGMWYRAHGEIPRSAVCLSLSTAEDAPCLLMAISAPLVLHAVDRLLGSDGTSPVRDRPLTESDKMVSRRLFHNLAHCLTGAWRELCGEELTAMAVRTPEQATDLAAVEEPTLAVTMRATVDGREAPLKLLIPFNAISALLARLSHQPARRAGDRAAVARTLSKVDIELRAQVAEVALSVDEVLALAPGDLLPLGAAAAEGVTLYASDVPVAPARPGRNGVARAVQVDLGLRPAPPVR